MKVGDTVRLNPLSRWNKGNISNPIDTDGVILTCQQNISFGIEVLWDNGEKNSYSKIDLVLVKSCEIVRKQEDIIYEDNVLVEHLNDLITKYKSVLVGIGELNSGKIFVRMSDGLWVVMTELGIQVGFYISNRDISTEKRRKTVIALDTSNQNHIDLIRNKNS
ncbi:MAG: hypothetical protein WAT79_08810 [Saprospiraceae bacterium]